MTASERREEPSGCLSCNEGPVRDFLRASGADLSRFVAVPPARHAWGDIVRCQECGQDWLIAPAALRAEAKG